MNRFVIPIVAFLNRYYLIILLVFFIAGPIWIFLDALIIWRKERKGVPPWVWLIAFFGGGLWIPPIYWIVRKPRRIARLIISILVFWFLPFFILLTIFGTKKYIKSQRLTELQLRLSKLEVGVTKDETLDQSDFGTFFMDGTIKTRRENAFEVWSINVKGKEYELFFANDSLTSIIIHSSGKLKPEK